jgi:pimeloyl-ACP methyl ester carboxylesterase
VITHGDAGPAWLRQVSRSAADRIGCESRLIAGAGHTPHHTHPEALAAVVEELALQPV